MISALRCFLAAWLVFAGKSRVNFLLAFSCVSALQATDFAEVLSNPKLNRAERAILVSAGCKTYISEMSLTAALAVIKSPADSSARLAVCWVKGLDKSLKPHDRLPFLGGIFNINIRINPFTAKMVFGWVLLLHTREYTQVSLLKDLQAAGWTIDQATFEMLRISYTGMYAN